MSSHHPVQKPIPTPADKTAPGIGGINDGSGRTMTHEKRPDQNGDHNVHRTQQTPRESKKE